MIKKIENEQNFTKFLKFTYTGESGNIFHYKIFRLGRHERNRLFHNGADAFLFLSALYI